MRKQSYFWPIIWREQSARKSIRKNSGNSWRNRKSDIFPNKKGGPGQMPRRYKKEIYVKKLYGFDVITGYCVSVSEIWKTFEKSVKGNG
jgi:hypothetical protein